METTSSPVGEPYVVTWWEGMTRRHSVMADEISAGRERASLKERSQVLVDRSLEPIRMMPKRVFEMMVQMRDDQDDRPCCHRPRLLRLCVECLGGMILHATS